jgi:hypothetical protein
MLEEEEEVNKENVLHVKRQPTLKRKPNSSRKEISHMAVSLYFRQAVMSWSEMMKSHLLYIITF